MGNFGLSCDVCNRENIGVTWVNGMKFCAKCYQETFGNKNMTENLNNMYDAYLKILNEKDQRIAELEEQLEEKEKTIEHWHHLYQKRDKQFQSVRQRYHLLNKLQSNYAKKDKLHLLGMQCLELVEENEKLKQQLKSQSAEIVEKIRQLLGLKLEYKHNENVPILKICNQINEVLDTILKEYQK